MRWLMRWLNRSRLRWYLVSEPAGPFLQQGIIAGCRAADPQLGAYLPHLAVPMSAVRLGSQRDGFAQQRDDAAVGVAGAAYLTRLERDIQVTTDTAFSLMTEGFLGMEDFTLSWRGNGPADKLCAFETLWAE